MACQFPQMPGSNRSVQINRGIFTLLRLYASSFSPMLLSGSYDIIRIWEAIVLARSMRTDSDMTEGSIWRHLIEFSIPMTIQILAFIF